MSTGRRIPEATVARLPRYLRALEAVAGEQTVSSEGLAALAGVTAAQVRKDLSNLGSYGTRGIGYDVAYLSLQISRELGLDGERRVAIVGVGNLGRALASYVGFPARGFHVAAAFDLDPAKVGQLVGPVRVLPMSELERTVRREKITTAILTTPAHAAQGAAEALVCAGVASILNFAPVHLTVPEQVAVRQVDLGTELQILSYYEQHGPVPAVANSGRSRAG